MSFGIKDDTSFVEKKLVCAICCQGYNTCQVSKGDPVSQCPWTWKRDENCLWILICLAYAPNQHKTYQKFSFFQKVAKTKTDKSQKDDTFSYCCCGIFLFVFYFLFVANNFWVLCFVCLFICRIISLIYVSLDLACFFIFSNGILNYCLFGFCFVFYCFCVDPLKTSNHLVETNLDPNKEYLSPHGNTIRDISLVKYTFMHYEVKASTLTLLHSLRHIMCIIPYQNGHILLCQVPLSKHVFRSDWYHYCCVGVGGIPVHAGYSASNPILLSATWHTN